MSNTDPIADLLTRIRNAHVAKHDRLELPTSKLKLEVCRILKDEGFIKNYKELEEQPADRPRRRPDQRIRIYLRYSSEGVPAISHLERVSRPGRRVYRKAADLRPVLNGMGLGIVSTSQGLLSDRQARERRLGGEVMCEVW